MTDIFKKGFNYLMGYPVFFVPPLIPAIVSLLASFIFITSATAAIHSGKGLMLAFIMLILGVTITLVVQLVTSAMLIHMAQVVEEGYAPSLKDSLQASMDRLGDIVVASLIVSVAVGIGLLLLVLPGLVLAFLFIFTLQEVVVGNKSAVDAIRGSFEMVKGNFGNTLGFFIMLIIIILIIAGVLGLVPVMGDFVANLVITPYYYIVTTIYYLK
ncbi:MAG: hypothetical protein DRI91_02770, partial [Aquificota bacterium]